MSNDKQTDAARVGRSGLVRRFLCNHPANSLVVEKEQTVLKQNEDFEMVTYHLFCQNCQSAVNITHARMIGGVKAFLARGRDDTPNAEISNEHHK